MRLPQFHSKGIWLIPIFLLFTLFQAKSQNETGSITVTGKVTDEKGSRVPGATVVVKGTARTASAKEDGSFSIKVVTGKETLVVSSGWFYKQRVPFGWANQRYHSANRCKEHHARRCCSDRVWYPKEKECDRCNGIFWCQQARWAACNKGQIRHW